VREGRRKEFAKFPSFSDPGQRKAIPDPNAQSTFDACRLDFDAPESAQWRALYRELLALRHRHIVPSLAETQSIGATVLSERAVAARWHLNAGEILTLACNLGDQPAPVEAPSAVAIWGQAMDGMIPPKSTVAWISQA
jgi:maltooligosyltrehalose trehalohydrolase